LDINHDKYKGIVNDVTSRLDEWYDFSYNGNMLEDPFPTGWNEKFDDFDRLIIIKVFHPEKLMFALQDYV